MTDFDRFLDYFGRPETGTASEDVIRRLDAFPSGRRLIAAVGAGLFDAGFLSVASVREQSGCLGGWERWLPPNAFAYASSAFGMIYVAAPNATMWLLNAQIGSILPTEFQLDEAVAHAAQPTASDDLLQRPLFHDWLQANKCSCVRGYLLSDPPVIEAGAWRGGNLSESGPSEFLSATSALFQPIGPNPVSLMEPGT